MIKPASNPHAAGWPLAALLLLSACTRPAPAVQTTPPRLSPPAVRSAAEHPQTPAPAAPGPTPAAGPVVSAAALAGFPARRGSIPVMPVFGPLNPAARTYWNVPCKLSGAPGKDGTAEAVTLGELRIGGSALLPAGTKLTGFFARGKMNGAEGEWLTRPAPAAGAASANGGFRLAAAAREDQKPAGSDFMLVVSSINALPKPTATPPLAAPAGPAVAKTAPAREHSSARH